MRARGGRTERGWEGEGRRDREREREGNGRESSLSNGTCTRDRECGCDMKWHKGGRHTAVGRKGVAKRP